MTWSNERLRNLATDVLAGLRGSPTTQLQQQYPDRPNLQLSRPVSFTDMAAGPGPGYPGMDIAQPSPYLTQSNIADVMESPGQLGPTTMVSPVAPASSLTALDPEPSSLAAVTSDIESQLQRVRKQASTV